ncbi:hypothetical protein ABZX85_17250 [Streptomyces sp. NPDC004539]|uniref:hypothetical protein n=1 Tax=Streptomyces sp. NPDC004539 TaxID=3154280 RepID=UPI0033B2C122
MKHLRLAVLATVGTLCAAALCTGAATADADPAPVRVQTPHTINVGRPQTVAPHSGTNVNVPCQSPEQSSGGGVRTTGTGVFIAASWSSAGWEADVYNESNSPQTVTPVAICTTQRHTRRSSIPTVRVPAGQSGLARAFCPAGMVTTGGGNIGGTQGASRMYMSQSSDIGASEWVVQAFNHSAFEQQLPAQVVCTDTPHSARASGGTQLTQGATGTAHIDCPAGEVPTGGGGLGNPAVQFNESYPTATGWTVRATNNGSQPLTLFARVTCTRP